MTGNTRRLIADEKERFLQHHKPTFDGYRKATRIERDTSSDIRDTKSKIVAAEAQVGNLKEDDPRSLAIPWWVEGLVLLVLAAGEGFVNYLAAAGLLQDDDITYGVTVFLTLLVGFLAWGLAREDQNRRRDERDGRPSTISARLVVLIGATVAYLVLSLILRERYFSETSALASAAGSLAGNSWVVAGALTVLAGIGIVVSAYILSHADSNLAAAKRQVRLLNNRLTKLEAAKAAALQRKRDASATLQLGAEVSANNVINRLGAESSQLDDDDGSEEEAVLEHFHALWKRLITDPESPGDPSVARRFFEQPPQQSETEPVVDGRGAPPPDPPSEEPPGGTPPSKTEGE